MYSLVFMSCAPSSTLIHTDQYATTATAPPPEFLAPREIVNKPGYVEVSASVITRGATFAITARARSRHGKI
jgi:hypothetical protein